MSLILQSPPLPLTMDAGGVIRIGKTRITLDTGISSFQNGSTAEQIAHDYDVLELADIYAVIHFYLHNRQQVEDYLAEKRKEGQIQREQWEKGQDAGGIRKGLLARKEGMGQNHDSSSCG